MSDVGPDTRLLRRTAITLGLQAAALVTLTVIALVALATVVVLHAQNKATERLLHTAALTADDVVDPPAGLWLTIRGDGVQKSSARLPVGLPVGADLTQVERTGQSLERDVHTPGGREFRTFTATTNEGAVQASLDLREDHAERGRLLTALASGGLVGLLSAALVGTLLGRRAVRPLSDALALQRRFVADASHELRTPLTLLSTRAQLVSAALSRSPHADSLRDDNLRDDTLRADAAGVVIDARHLAGIVDDLLTAADPRAPRAPIDLLDLLDTVARSAAPDAAADGVSVEVAATNEVIVAAGQEVALRRALTALVDNAVQHSPINATVVLSTGLGARRTATLSVTDEGSGVAPSRLVELVGRFHSEANTNGRRRYGLGLALADEVATRHGGHLDVTPGPSGRGSCFTITIPLGKTERKSL